MKNLVFILFLFSVIAVKAQDPQFTQFYAAPMYLNPAFSGVNGGHRIIANYRKQWPNIPGAFNTYNFSYDRNLSDINSGLGFMVTHDKSGAGGLSYTQIKGQYAYQINLTRRLYLRSALEFGYNWRYLDKTRLVFGDQLVRGPGFNTLEFLQDGRSNYADFGSGLLLYTKHWWAGFAVHHLNIPNESILGDLSPIPMKYSIHAGYKIPIHDFFGKHLDNHFIPAFNYKAQGKFDQFDVGFYYERSPLVFGIWYRGIPGLKAYEQGYQNNDALIFLMGYKTEKLKLGYSYDITISRLVTNTLGSHEISIIYEFGKSERSILESVRDVPCPKF